MNQSLWIAKTGLDAQQTKLSTISNNLANASTAGFKRSRAVFEDCSIKMCVSPVRNLPRTPSCPRG